MLTGIAMWRRRAGHAVYGAFDPPVNDCVGPSGLLASKGNLFLLPYRLSHRALTRQHQRRVGRTRRLLIDWPDGSGQLATRQRRLPLGHSRKARPVSSSCRGIVCRGFGARRARSRSSARRGGGRGRRSRRGGGRRAGGKVGNRVRGRVGAAGVSASG